MAAGWVAGVSAYTTAAIAVAIVATTRMGVLLCVVMAVVTPRTGHEDDPLRSERRPARRAACRSDPAGPAATGWPQRHGVLRHRRRGVPLFTLGLHQPDHFEFGEQLVHVALAAIAAGIGLGIGRHFLKGLD